MILVDTSIWIDHLHRADSRLADDLVAGQVCIHELVIGELALGRLHDRAVILHLLDQLPRARSASDAEVRVLVEERRLWGSRLSLVDAHLLASALVTPGVRLRTRDRRLAAAAELAGVS